MNFLLIEEMLEASVYTDHPTILAACLSVLYDAPIKGEFVSYGDPPQATRMVALSIPPDIMDKADEIASTVLELKTAGELRFPGCVINIHEYRFCKRDE